MRRQRMAKTLLACALVGAFGLAGCTQQRASRTPDQPGRPAPAQTGDDCNWPTMAGGDLNWTTLAYPTGQADTSAVGVEKGVPAQVRVDQPFDYQIVVTNLTSTTLTDVSVTEELGDNFTLNSSNPQGQAGAGNTVTWVLGTLGPCESKAIRLNGTATAPGSIGSCASVTYNNLLCATIPVVQPALSLTKTGPAEVLRCDEITYTFTVANTGTGSIEDVEISDPLPAGLTTMDGGNSIDIAVGTLNGGQSKEYTRTVKADRTGRFVNTATASAGNLSAESGDVTTVVREPVLRITKTGTEQQFIGRNATYEITVTNTGDAEARDTVIRDAVPSGARFVSASEGGRLTGNAVTWNVGTLAPEASRTVELRLVRDTAGTIRNEATAEAYCAEAVAATAETVYSGIPAILLEVIDVDDPVQVGDQTTYVIRVTNQGSAPDTNVRITATLPAQQDYVSSSGATRGSARGQAVTFEPIGSLAPKAQAEFRIVVRANTVGNVRFAVTLNSDRLGETPVQETEATNLYE